MVTIVSLISIILSLGSIILNIDTNKKMKRRYNSEKQTSKNNSNHRTSTR